MLRGKLQSPARTYLEGLRNYPAARGEAEGASAAIRKTIERAQGAAHEIAMRIIRTKVRVSQPFAEARDGGRRRVEKEMMCSRGRDWSDLMRLA